MGLQILKNYIRCSLFLDVSFISQVRALDSYSVEYKVIILVLAPLLASYLNFIPPMAGSFNCDDPSVKFPLFDTVSTKLLLSMVILPSLSL